MKGIFQKISLICDKIKIIELYSTGEKVHDVYSRWNQNCECLEYLNELRNLIDSVTSNELHVDHRINFIEISKKNLKTFLLYDQINKKFGSEIFIMDENVLKTAIKFDVDKIKTFLKAIDTMEKLEGYIYVFANETISNDAEVILND